MAGRTYGMMLADKMNLDGREGSILRTLRFDAADYKWRHGATTGAVPSSQINLNSYKEMAEEDGRRLATVDCTICCENVTTIFAHGIKLYKLPQCQHMVYNQCLVCMYAAGGDRHSFKIMVVNDDGTQEEVPETITRNSNYAYIKCPHCR